MSTIYTYTVNVIDSETPSPWMALPGVVSCKPGNQDSGMCRFTVQTTDAVALVESLKTDESVVEYELLETNG